MIKPKFRRLLRRKLKNIEKLGREFKFKQEDTKAVSNAANRSVMGPVRQDIGNAMQEYAKKKGYVFILDASKLTVPDFFWRWTKNIDVTKEFITFYNARPATTAVSNTT